MLTGGNGGIGSGSGSGSIYLSSTILYPGGCSVPSMEIGRYMHVTFLTQDSSPRITICGGRDRGYNYKRDCLVLQSGGWRGGELDDLPDNRHYSASARLDAGVFILGGYYTPSSSLFLRANSRSWVEGPQLPVSMSYGPCAAPISDHSFLIVYERYVYEFDTRVGGPTSRAGWRERATWPQLQVSRRYGPGCAVVGNKLIVAGGSNVDDYLKSTEIIDIEMKTIVFGGDMEKTRGWFHLLSIQGTLHAVGGHYKEGSQEFFLKDVEEFVEETGTWKPVMSLSGVRSSYGGVAVPVNFDLLCD